MKNWILFLLFGLLTLSTIVACGGKDDDDPENCAEGWEMTVNDEIEKLVDASTVWANSGTSEDCEKYKQAYRNYIQALRQLEECYIFYGQQQQWREALEEAEEEIDDIQC